VLPFLGKVRELPVRKSGGRIRAVIPEVDKAAVAWLE